MVAGAFLVPWWRRRAFGRALAVPAALFFLYSAAWHFAGARGWLATLAGTAVYGLVFSLFAVTCHRLVLLGPESASAGWRPRWTRRETRFFLWVAALWLGGAVAMLVLLAIVVNAWNALAGYESIELAWARGGVGLALLYPLARLCVLFPATAVDREPRPTLRWAWRATRGNGARLLVIVGALPWLFSLLVDLLYRSGASWIEWLLVGVLAMALFAVEIAAVSIAYRELVQ